MVVNIPLEQLKNRSLLSEFSILANRIQSAKTIQEAGEAVYDMVSDSIPCELFLIHHKNSTDESSLLFIRTKNDSTITGRVMNQEHKVSNQLLLDNIHQQTAILPTTPPLNYAGVTCRKNEVACCLSLLRTNEFSEQELELAYVALQIFFSAYLGEMLQAKSEKLGTQELNAKQQNNFIASITHDLRNPLGCIKGYASTLLREDIVWDQETQKKFITVIDDEADRLADMITNMLETARLESGEYELNFDQVAVSTLMKTLLEGNKSRHPSLNIAIEYPKRDELMMIDTMKIIRAFQNLVDNTVKHANSFQIWIKIRASHNIIHFYFIDKGEGIPHSRWKSVFNKFSRIPDDSPGKHGSGLGLYITKQIILKHGGEIEIDEAATEGTTIRVSIPKIPSMAVNN